jgi:hypothetical protein
MAHYPCGDCPVVRCENTLIGYQDHPDRRAAVVQVTSIEVRPLNSLLLVMDPDHGLIPESMSGRLVVATESCLAVGTLSEADGPTRVDVIDVDDFRGVEDGSWVAWEGALATASERLAVMDVLGDVLAERQVGPSVAVRLIVNDDNEPDRISVVVGGSYAVAESVFERTEGRRGASSTRRSMLPSVQSCWRGPGQIRKVLIRGFMPPGRSWSHCHE